MGVRRRLDQMMTAPPSFRPPPLSLIILQVSRVDALSPINAASLTALPSTTTSQAYSRSKMSVLLLLMP